MLAIEYDVSSDGLIEIVAVINAVELEGADPDGAAWLSWRRTHEDGGMGCAPISADTLAQMEAAKDTQELRAIVESALFADRRTKEQLS